MKEGAAVSHRADSSPLTPLPPAVAAINAQTVGGRPGMSVSRREMPPVSGDPLLNGAPGRTFYAALGAVDAADVRAFSTTHVGGWALRDLSCTAECDLRSMMRL